MRGPLIFSCRGWSASLRHAHIIGRPNIRREYYSDLVTGRLLEKISNRGERWEKQQQQQQKN